MMRWFNRLVDVIEGWMERRTRRSQKEPSLDWLLRHEKGLIRIAENAAILGGREVTPAQIVTERTLLRERRGLGGKRKLRDILVLTTLGAFLAYGAVDAIQTALAGGQIGKLVFRILVIVVLTILSLAAWTAFSRTAERGVQSACDHLGAEGGLSREKAILDWLDRHWKWPAPPGMFEGTTADLQGTRAGWPFLVMSQVEYGEEPQFETALNRTCVFIAGDGGPVRKLPTVTSSVLELPVHLAITPAGLFAYWATGTLWGRRPPEQWERMLDEMILVACREGIKPMPAAGSDGKVHT